MGCLKIIESLIPEKIRFFFNMTIYPSKTDKWLRSLFQMLLDDSEKVWDPQTRHVSFLTWMTIDLLKEKSEWQ